MTTPLTSRPEPRAPQARQPGAILIFAAVTLFMTGGFNVLFGLAAVLNDAVASVGGNGGATIGDFGTWGWVLIPFGVLLMGTGVGLGLGVAAARWTAIVLVTLDALLQFPLISAFPLLGIGIVALNVVILYQLLANWYE